MTGSHRTWILAVACAYVAAVLAVGGWGALRARTPRDFFVAGRRPGLLVTALATMAAAFSGFVFVGGPGLTLRLGLASLWIVLPASFTAGLLCWTVGGRLRALAEIREVYTIPDAVAWRFGSPSAAGLAAVAVALGSAAYLAAQMLALGVVTQEVLGVESLALAIAIGALLLVAYSAWGGMLAGVYTEVAQGGVMLVAACAVFAQAMIATGGPRALLASIASSPAFGRSFLEPFGAGPALTAFGLFFVFGVGVLGQPHVLHKFVMVRDPAALRWLPLVLGASQALCLLVWIGIGFAVPALVADGRMALPEPPDRAAPRFLLEHAPAGLAALAFVAALAAIMSTANALLGVGSAALVRDLPRALGRPLRSELGPGRAAGVGLAAAAALGAWAYGDLVALLGTLAFGTFAAALAPTFAIGFGWSRVSARAAVASMAAGLLVHVGLEALGRVAAPPWPLAPGAVPSAVALAVSFAVLLLVTWLAPARAATLPPDLRAVVEER
jgi:Na+/proline symporter